MPSTQASTSATIAALKAPERFGRAMARAAGARRSLRAAGKSPRRTDVVTVRGAGRAPEARPPAARPTVAGLAALRPEREAGRDDGAWREEAGRTGAAAGRRARWSPGAPKHYDCRIF